MASARGDGGGGVAVVKSITCDAVPAVGFGEAEIIMSGHYYEIL